MAYTKVRLPDIRNREDIIIDSNEFQELVYKVKDNHLIIYGGENGTIAFDMRNADRFLSEVKAVVAHYS